MKKLLFSLLLLTGCGFTPLYSQSNHFLKDTKVVVNPIPNQYGAQMRKIIQDSLYTQVENPTYQYRLTVNPPSFKAGDKTISTNELASMMEIKGTSTYYLEDVKVGKRIYSGQTVAVSSYSVVRDPYATTVARKSIEKELSEQLAQQISLDILSKLSQEPS